MIPPSLYVCPLPSLFFLVFPSSGLLVSFPPCCRTKNISQNQIPASSTHLLFVVFTLELEKLSSWPCRFYQQMTFLKDLTIKMYILWPYSSIENDLAFLSCLFFTSFYFCWNPWHFEIPLSKSESLSCMETAFLRTILSLEPFICAEAWKEGIILYFIQKMFYFFSWWINPFASFLTL